MRPGDVWLNPASQQETISITLLLKPPAGQADQLLSGQFHPTSADSQERTAADPQVTAAVQNFAAQYGLTIRSNDPASRRIVLEGTVDQMNQAFGIEIGQMRDAAGHTFRSYLGTIQVPPQLAGDVTAVLGFDQRPVARRAGT